MIRRWTAAWGVLVVAAAGFACDQDDEPGADEGGDGDGDASDIRGDGLSADGAGPADPWASPPETGDWRVLWSYRGRAGSQHEGDNELWISGPMGEDRRAITDLGGLEGLDPPLSCNYGCVVSPDLRWLAVVTGPPDADGFDFRIGRFDADLQVHLLKGGGLTGKVDFHFAGSNLFYSERADCDGPSCQYDIYRVDLEESVGAPVKIQTYPPEPDLAQSTYKGHFKVAPDGKSLVMLNTTIRSVQVHAWREGPAGGLIELDFICPFGSKGNCTGTGSEYTDVDPVGISPDGRYVVFFTFSERWQRARVYDLEGPGVAYISTIASVPSGSYINRACDPGMLEDWQWERVLGNPVFTPDGSEIVFRTETDCDPGEPKPRTNLRRIRLDTLLEEKDLVEQDVFDVTNNPFGDVTDNRRITGFDVAPDGATIVFTATPEVTQGDVPIDDGASRQRNDRELYRVRMDGTHRIQLTNEIGWRAESPRIVPPAPEGRASR